jgi:hypothetical protein
LDVEAARARAWRVAEEMEQKPRRLSSRTKVDAREEMARTVWIGRDKEARGTRYPFELSIPRGKGER